MSTGSSPEPRCRVFLGVMQVALRPRVTDVSYSDPSPPEQKELFVINGIVGINFLVSLVLYGSILQVYQNTLIRRIIQSSEVISQEGGNAEDRSIFQILELEQARFAGLLLSYMVIVDGFLVLFFYMMFGNLVMMYTGTKRSEKS